MIAPLITLTYPLDKIKDKKSQAFDMWLKEFIFNALIQPLHLLLYIVLLGSATELAIDNPKGSFHSLLSFVRSQPYQQPTSILPT